MTLTRVSDFEGTTATLTGVDGAGAKSHAGRHNERRGGGG
jgi:hypothetical protein